MLVWKQLIHKMKFHNLETEIHICGNGNCNLGLYESDFFNSWIAGSQFGFPLSESAGYVLKQPTPLVDFSKSRLGCFVTCGFALSRNTNSRFRTAELALWKIQLWVSFVAIHQLTFSNSWTCIMKIQLWRLHWVLVAIVIWTFLCRESHFRKSENAISRHRKVHITVATKT